MTEAIETEHLRLLPISSEHVATFFRSRSELAALIGASVPDEWPVCPESMAYWREKSDRLQEAAGWAGYLYIHKSDGTVVGDGGFKGPPNARGTVEMGYAVVPAYRNRGLANEAAQALLDWAFKHREVNYVTAETLPQGKESMRVVEKLGMAFQGVRTDPEEGGVFLWRLSRQEYNTPRTPPETDGCPFS